MLICNTKLEIILAEKRLLLQDVGVTVSKQTLTRIRKNKSVRPATVGKIAKVLNVSVKDLVKEETS